jgi:hypothetical protein
MTEEDFLSRWSRRKREARTDAPQTAEVPALEAGDTVTTPGDTAGEPEIDLSSLPPIDSITAETDITAFLRKGIPQELTRAALRRAWDSDPVIRDFVGLVENAWDFNDPTAMAGFGPLDGTGAELGEVVERIVGGVRDVTDRLTNGDAPGLETAREAGSECQEDQEAHSTVAGNGPAVRDQLVSVESTRAVAASQRAETEPREPSLRRKHGGALPRDADDGPVSGSRTHP